MSGPLILAVPSKGRLQQAVEEFFARAGLRFERAGGERDYRGQIDGVEGIEIAYLAASDIAREIAAGKVHVGVTGEDLVHDALAAVESKVLTVTRLGLGHARVVVAVPRAWIDVDTMADLDEVASSFRARHGRPLRVATKYVRLTRAFFSRHDIADYRIVESLGATEGAPAAGAAEAIVDITTTGSTLAANALKVLRDGEILASQAALFASRAAAWTDQTRARLRLLCDRLAAEARARTMREIHASVVVSPALLVELQQRHGALEPFTTAPGMTLLHAPVEAVFAVVERLREAGASTVSVSRPDYVFAGKNPLWEAIAGRL